jgi:hypothetical protein
MMDGRNVILPLLKKGYGMWSRQSCLTSAYSYPYLSSPNAAPHATADSMVCEAGERRSWTNVDPQASRRRKGRQVLSGYAPGIRAGIATDHGAAALAGSHLLT